MTGYGRNSPGWREFMTLGHGQCQWCGAFHTYVCPLVKSYEYHPDGTLKRVEFKDEASRPDYRSTPITGNVVDS